MNWSWKLGRFAGIDVFIHWTFLALLVWLGVQELAQGNGVLEAVKTITLIIAVFGCVVLHEYGHALTARRYGVATRDITLLPIGGVARLERIPEDPWQEFWIAVAGPAVNVAIAVMLAAGALAVAGLTELSGLGSPFGASTSFWVDLIRVNIYLVAFNLLPAFPMDGGRVLRAILAGLSGNRAWASRIAANVGVLFAIGFAIVGLLLSQPMLLFIALFVFLAGQQEASQAEMRSMFKGWPASEAMMTRFRVLAPNDTLSVAVTEVLAGSQHDFPVVDNERVVGVLMRQDLMKALADGGRQTRVGDLARITCLAEANEPLDAAMERMREQGCSAAPVLHNGRLVGLLTLENIGELTMIQTALRQVATSKG